MSVRADKILIHDILECCEKIVSYIDEVDQDAFNSNEILQDALIRKLEVIGEAAKGLSMGLRDSYPEVPWKQLTGLRDRVVHQYFRVDLEVIWTTVTGDIPELHEQITSINDERFS